MSYVGETLRAIIQTRLVIVMLFLVLLLLTSCYAASFTSLMRAQRQRTPIRTLDELIRNRAKIGNQKGSFVPRLLIKRGFSEDQIMIYDTEQQIVDMLSKGIDQGGVSAIIDETPYLKVFLSKNCNKGYTLVPSFDLHAEGFGFVRTFFSFLVYINRVYNILQDFNKKLKLITCILHFMPEILHI